MGQDLGVLSRSLEEHKYVDFGRYVGQFSQRLAEEPKGALRCTGIKDFLGTFPLCYEGSAGLPGLTEYIKLKFVSYADGVGIVNFDCYGLDKIRCRDVPFTKKGQE